MSKHHENCQSDVVKKPNKILNSKPLCDCSRCMCSNCPDILKMLSITVTDSTCEFGTKKRCRTKPPEETKPPDTINILDIINPDRSCNCEVVARGIRDHVHMNLGLTERREKILELDNYIECDTKLEQKKIVIPEVPKFKAVNKTLTIIDPKDFDMKDSRALNINKPKAPRDDVPPPPALKDFKPLVIKDSINSVESAEETIETATETLKDLEAKIDVELKIDPEPKKDT